MSALSLELRNGADPARARAALEASDAGPVRLVGDVLFAGEAVAPVRGGYVSTTAQGTRRSDSLRAMLSTGLVPRRWSGPAAAGWLWAGIPLVPVVEGVRREPAPPPSTVVTSVTEGDVERAVLEIVRDHARLRDDSLASRGLPAGGTTRRVGWHAPASPSHESEYWLEATTLDVARHFDEFLSTSDVPTVAGFEADLLEALATRAGLGRLVSAEGGDALFAAGDEARRACRRPRPRILRRRFRPAPDPLDVAAVRAAEIAGLEGAPLHRVSSIGAVLPTQTREAVARFGPRDAPVGLVHDGDVASIWSAIATLDRDAPMLARPGGTRLIRPFADAHVRALVERLPRAARFGRPGSGGALVRWAAASASATASAVDGMARLDPRVNAAGTFDSFLDAACRGPLASRLEAVIARAAASPAFHASGVTSALARFRAGTHGWTGRRITTIAFLAAFLERERLTGDPSNDASDPPPSFASS
jgi:hypothetical protein